METQYPLQDHYDVRLEHQLRMSVFNQCMGFVDGELLSLSEAKQAYERVMRGEPMFPDTFEEVVATDGLRAVFSHQ